MPQLEYTNVTPKWIPGQLLDLNYYGINSRTNEEDDGDLLFGHGVVVGANTDGVTLPTSSFSDVSKFEGIVLHSHNAENDSDGKLNLKNKVSVNVLEWGRAAGIVVPGKTYAYDDQLYLVVEANAETGALPGMFSNVATEDGEYTDTTNIKLNGRFLGAANNGLAGIELFNVRTQ